MSDTTIQRLALPGRPGRTGQPDDYAAHPSERPSLSLEREDLSSWEPPRRTHAGSNRLVVRSSGKPAPGSSAAAFQQLTVELDDAGGVIVADPEGAAYGIGQSYGEAVEQWQHAAREHLEELSALEAQLHPRMQRQLAFLRLLFG